MDNTFDRELDRQNQARSELTNRWTAYAEARAALETAISQANDTGLSYKRISMIVGLSHTACMDWAHRHRRRKERHTA